jgi:hypothetical protein
MDLYMTHIVQYIADINPSRLFLSNDKPNFVFHVYTVEVQVTDVRHLQALQRFKII